MSPREAKYGGEPELVGMRVKPRTRHLLGLLAFALVSWTLMLLLISQVTSCVAGGG